MKKLFILTAFMLLSTNQIANAFTTEGAGCAQDCASCHSLSIEEANKLLKADEFKIHIDSVTDAPIKGLFEVRGTTQQNKHIKVFIDYSKKNLIEGTFNFTKLEDLGKPPKLKKTEVNDELYEGTVIMGNKKGKTKIVVFDDPDCPYCKKIHAELKKIIAKRKDVAIYIKMFPLISIHPQAYDKSKTILCEDSVELLEKSLNSQAIPAPTCETDQVDKNIKYGAKIGISGTPAIVLPDGRILPGYTTADNIMQAIDHSLDLLKQEKKNKNKKK